MSDSSSTVDPDVLDDIRRHLEALRSTEDGQLLYNLIERGLSRYGAGSGAIGQSFLTFMASLLQRYATQDSGDPVTRFKVRMIQQRIAPMVAEPAAPRSRAEAAPPETPAAASRRPEATTSNVPPTPARSAALPPREAEREPMAATEQPAPAGSRPNRLAPPALIAPPAPMMLDPPPATDYLSARDRARLERLEATLAEKLSQAILRTDGFAQQLRSNLEALQRIGQYADGNTLKRILRAGLEELVAGHADLNRDLQSTRTYMRALGSDRKQLTSALRRMGKFSALDMLTGLPRRDAFARQLKAETSRARRYGFSVALALIDVDGLDDINTRHGREVGDRVLKCYAQELSSQLRGYDAAARYGEDEFAIMLPNTHKQGALATLDKLKQRLATTSISVKERNLPVPGFSSIITLLAPGEDPETLMTRAERALSEARMSGAIHVVLSMQAD